MPKPALNQISDASCDEDEDDERKDARDPAHKKRPVFTVETAVKAGYQPADPGDRMADCAEECLRIPKEPFEQELSSRNEKRTRNH